MAASKIAFFSILVISIGTHTISSGLNGEPPYICLIKALSISLVASISEITPSVKGLITTVLSAVFPSISLASFPTATISPVFLFFTITDGSFNTILFFCLS